ncbi:MAG: hypothetical protein FWH20_05300 [Oscillospiraceae bacterium]|nr:hypothetical protein [Oscillospiraceae bacterium]
MPPFVRVTLAGFVRRGVGFLGVFATMPPFVRRTLAGFARRGTDLSRVSNRAPRIRNQLLALVCSEC